MYSEIDLLLAQAASSEGKKPGGGEGRGGAVLYTGDSHCCLCVVESVASIIQLLLLCNYRYYRKSVKNSFILLSYIRNPAPDLFAIQLSSKYTYSCSHPFRRVISRL